MRTTVEITDAQRARLLEIAARQGEKGFSRLIREAIDLYLETVDGSARRERVRAALGVLGGMTEKAASELEANVRSLRRSWR
ncbi:MAG: ribbon-helix-helix protein, CopG family [Planctomycetota bacterium]|jgi:metal-responsive CopG/Arc/MetJ family transcriptional regulator